MKMYVISDNADTLIGFRLAGIDGVVAHEVQKAEEELDKACHESDIGIIMITESLSQQMEEKINQLKINSKMPIVTTIPDRYGFRREKNYITKIIKESIGLKI